MFTNSIGFLGDSDYMKDVEDWEKEIEKKYKDKRRINKKYIVPEQEYKEFSKWKNGEKMDIYSPMIKITIQEIDKNELQNIYKKSLDEYIEENVIYSEDFQEYVHQKVSDYIVDKVEVTGIEYDDDSCSENL